MAKSYYGQSKRPEVNGIDWGQIGTDISTKLIEESKRREDLKIEIDQASNDYVRGFNDMPQGTDQGANERMSNFASDASDYMLMLNRKLKSGDIKLRDYNAAKTNLEKGTTDMFAVSKAYNEQFDSTMKRVANGEASALETWNNSNLQKFADPSASGVYINPTTGQISVAKMVTDKNGVRTMSQNPNDLSSIFSLKNKQTQQIDKFNIGGWADTTVSSFKNQYSKILNQGDVGEIKSLLQSEDFKSAKKKIIESALEAPYTGQSILADSDFNDKYTYSANPEDEGKEGIIFLQPDPNNPNAGVLVPKLTDKQKSDAYEILDDQIDGRLGYEEVMNEESDRKRKKLANEKTKQAIDFFTRTEDLNFEKLELEVEGAKQRIDVIAKKAPEELIALGLSNQKVEQLIKHLAKKNPEELRTMELSIENTEAIMKERSAKHDSDMASAKTKEEKERIELLYLDEEKQLKNLLTNAQINKVNKPTQWEAKDAKEKKVVSNYVKKIGLVFDGTETQIDESLNYISNANKDIQEIKRKGDVVEVKMFDVDGETTIIKTIPMSNKKAFVESMSALLANELDVTGAMEGMGYDDTGTYTDYEASTAVTTEEDKKSSYSLQLASLLDSAIDRDLFTSKSMGQIGSDDEYLKDALLKMTEADGPLRGFKGMVIETSAETGMGIADEIEISFPGVDKKITINTNNYFSSDDTEERDKLRKYLQTIGKANLDGLAKVYDFDDNADITTYLDYSKK